MKRLAEGVQLVLADGVAANGSQFSAAALRKAVPTYRTLETISSSIAQQHERI
jgi:hypothetical protein